MIHLLFGQDELTLSETLKSLKEEVGPEELRDVNVTTLAGAQVGFDELTGTCDTVPFLAEKRMVVVQGLLSSFERRPQARSGARASSPSRERPLGQWEALPQYLSSMPPTTDLVFVDGHLTGSNPLFAKLRRLAQVRAFPAPAGSELRRWIQQRAAKRGMEIESRAVSTLADTIGGNLRVIDLELEKLSLYCWGRTVRHEDVQALVSYAREVNIFATVDAVLEGRPGLGIRLIHRLLESNGSPQQVISMLARQVRLLLLAKDLRGQRVSQSEIGGRLSLSGFPLTKTLQQERVFTAQRLAEIHHSLLAADLSIKTGAYDGQLAMDMLIAELTSTAARN